MSEPETAAGARIQLAKKTDLGNAQKMAARYADVMRYVRATDTWHVWDNTRWAADETGAVDRLARETVRAMQREADGMSDEHEDDKLKALKWGVACEAAARLSAMVQLARYEEGVAARAGDFDTDPWGLNCVNGIVDLRTGKLANHDPAAMHSLSTGIRYVRDAPRKKWDAFVKKVLPSKATRDYVQKLLGASLVGAPLPAATFPFVYGEGSTGKSTLLETVLAATGDYGRMAPPNLLVAKRGGGGEQTYDVAALRGKRFVLASEGHARQRLAEDLVKRITDGKTMTARQIREAEIEFANVTALWFMSNHEPRIDSTDTGIRRRIKEIPMDVVLGPELAGLKDALIETELEGVLAWCVAGCVAWQKDGIEAPAEVEAATQAYFDEANPLLEWYEAACIEEESGFETAVALHAAYVDWCAVTRRRNDYVSPRGKAWGRALKSIGLEPGRKKLGKEQVRGYSGVTLRALHAAPDG